MSEMGVSRVRARVNWRKAVKVALTVLVLAAVLLRFPAAEAFAALQRLDPLWVAIGTACMVLDRVVFVTRWHLLLAPIGVRQSLLYSLGVAMVGYFYGMIAISTLGLDAARVILPAQRHRVRKADLAACVFVDRLAGIVAISTMGLVPLIAGQRGAIRASLLTVTAMGAAGLLFFAWLATLQSPVSGTRGALPARWLDKARESAVRAAGQVILYRKHPMLLVAAVCISWAGILVGGVGMWAWCRALGADVTVSDGVSTNIIMTVFSAIPTTIGGLGVVEGGFIVILGWAGVSQADALAFALGRRVVGTAVNLLGGAVQFIGGTTRDRRTGANDTTG
ncbi:MAG: flippase-like domain-containing protein [Armatimonadetes bacterium]|nr:flippase-like domain-containing protein [Armatimonadota bacterium]